MTLQQIQLAEALYKDLRQSYPSMTREFVLAECESVSAGNKPDSIAGVFAEKMYRKAGLL